MDYLVVGPNGQEYGPANVDTLKQWVAENRLGPQTMLKDFQTGQAVAASSVPGLFPPPVTAPPAAGQPMSAGPVGAPGSQNWSQPPSYYQGGPGNQQARPYYGQDTGGGDVLWAIVRSALAIVLFFFLKGIGLIVATFGVIYAFRGVSKGHKLGWVAVAISVTALIIVLIGWVFRLNGAGV